tara:strand:- start:711 stop:1316 length:606 start_codon:yes stop_codon:yes gene_type:complete
MKKLIINIFFLFYSIVAIGQTDNIIIYGDSLSAGYGIEINQSWPALLQDRLKTNKYSHQVVNSSISGETTEGGVARIGGILDRYAPQIVIIELGGNDGLRGFPVHLIQNNLEKMVQKCQEKNISVILLGIKIPLNYGPRYTIEFEKMYQDIAVKYDIELIDFFMKDVALNKNLMQDDGIHPNEKAQPILLNNVWETIKKSI